MNPVYSVKGFYPPDVRWQAITLIPVYSVKCLIRQMSVDRLHQSFMCIHPSVCSGITLSVEIILCVFNQSAHMQLVCELPLCVFSHADILSGQGCAV